LEPSTDGACTICLPDRCVLGQPRHPRGARRGPSACGLSRRSFQNEIDDRERSDYYGDDDDDPNADGSDHPTTLDTISRDSNARNPDGVAMLSRGDEFAFDDMGEFELKGVPGLMRLRRVL
jgi:hypothetical protein